MTDTFTLDTSFLSKVAPASGQFYPDGWSNQGFMKGLDGNHYVITADSIGTAILCAETGSNTHITNARLIDDMTALGIANADRYSSANVLWSAPTTPYFYIVTEYPIGEYYIAAVLYKIVSDGTLTCVGGLNFSTRDTGHGGLAGPETFYGFSAIDNSLYVLGQVMNSVGAQKQPAVFTLPLTETFTQNLTPGAWDTYFNTNALTYGFFNYVNINRSEQAVATIVPLTGGRWGIMLYVGQADYDYMAAHPGVNTQWDAITGPGMWWCLSTDVSLTNVTSQFGFTDIKKHVDGTASSSYYDDYVSPSSFMISTRTYVMFARSYTLSADLEPIGTYARARIYLWDGTTATSAFDASSSLFDPVADCGVDEGSRTNSYPQFVQGGYDASTEKIDYVWYGHTGSLDFNYVFGGWIDVTPGTILDWSVTFSEFNNPAFDDWETQGVGVGADFTSRLTTYYMGTSDAMLFFQTPYVVTYMENTERNDAALHMRAYWDWSDDEDSNRFSRSTEIYRQATLEKVSVSKNRVRGRGRALQLNFTSEQGKDFNLLGWTVDVNRNARY